MGKRLIIVGADFSSIAIGKLLAVLSTNEIQYGGIATLTLSAPGTTNPTFSATTTSNKITISGSAGSYTVTAGSSEGSATITCSATYTEGGSQKTETTSVTISIVAAPVQSYTITGNITNGTLTGDTSVAQGGVASVSIVANEGYALPQDASSVSITGATIGSYDRGTMSIVNPTGNVTITATCQSQGGAETDITSLFTATFAAGAIYARADTDIGGAWNNSSFQANYANTSYVNVSQYAGKTLKITMLKTSSTSWQKVGLVFYTATGKSAHIEPGYNANSSTLNVDYEVREIVIPSNAVYARTTWWSAENAASIGATFSAKIVN